MKHLPQFQVGLCRCAQEYNRVVHKDHGYLWCTRFLSMLQYRSHGSVFSGTRRIFLNSMELYGYFDVLTLKSLGYLNNSRVPRGASAEPPLISQLLDHLKSPNFRGMLRVLFRGHPPNLRASFLDILRAHFEQRFSVFFYPKLTTVRNFMRVRKSFACYIENLSGYNYIILDLGYEPRFGRYQRFYDTSSTILRKICVVLCCKKYPK